MTESIILKAEDEMEEDIQEDKYRIDGNDSILDKAKFVLVEHQSDEETDDGNQDIFDCLEHHGFHIMERSDIEKIEDMRLEDGTDGNENVGDDKAFPFEFSDILIFPNQKAGYEGEKDSKADQTDIQRNEIGAIHVIFFRRPIVLHSFPFYTKTFIEEKKCILHYHRKRSPYK